MAVKFNPFTGTFDFVGSGSGGGGTPAGSSGDIQYNNAGAFGGVADSSFVHTTGNETIAGDKTLTGITQVKGDAGTSTAGGARVYGTTDALYLDVKGPSSQLLKLTDTRSSGSGLGAGFLAGVDDGAAMASGDRLGYNIFFGNDGTGTLANGTVIAGYANGAWSSGNNPAYLTFSTKNTSSSVERMRMGGSATSGVTINETGADHDFRVEGDTDQNLLFTDASTDKVGIGNNAPTEKLDVTGNIKASGTVVGSNLSGTNTGDQTLAGLGGLPNSYLDTDGTLTANSDTKLSTQKATKTYVDNKTTPTRTTVNNTNYTILVTDRYIAQTGTMSANRTLTLPLANAVSAGTEITVADESATVGKTPTSSWNLIVARAGSDTICSPLFPTTTTTDTISTPYGSRRFISNGVDKWMVLNPGERRPVFWLAHTNVVAIPSGVWCPMPWNKIYIDNSNSSADYTTDSFTLHSSMNGLVLPQASIKVNESLVAIAAVRTDGFIVITGPPGTGIDTVVHYNGIDTATSTFTGCTTGNYPAIATGTMATNQVVKRAQCEVSFKSPYLVQMGSIISLSAHPNGYRAMRLSNYALGIYYPFFNGTDAPSLNIDNQCISLVAQPPGQLGGGQGQAAVIEVYQNSGSVINSTIPSLATPIYYGYVASSE